MKYLIKRGSAYLIDLFIISIIAVIFMQIMPIQTNDIDSKIDSLYEQRINDEIKNDDFLKEYSELIKERDTANIGMTFLNINLIFIFFIIMPFYRKQTIGHRIMKLKIDGDVTIINLIKRNLIANALAYSLLSLLFLMLPSYFYLITIIGLTQIILVIKSLFMIIYRKDNCGIQDLISNTTIVEII